MLGVGLTTGCSQCMKPKRNQRGGSKERNKQGQALLGCGRCVQQRANVQQWRLETQSDSDCLMKCPGERGKCHLDKDYTPRLFCELVERGYPEQMEP